jgi:hypothetical protein
MSDLLFSIIDIPYLTTGRRIYALKQCLELAEAAGNAPLIILINEAIAHETGATELEQSWSRSKSVTKTRGQSAVLDGQIDGVIGVIYTTANSHISALDPSDPLVADSKKIIAKLFPEGVAAIIHQAFEEQLVSNDTIVAALKGELSEAAARIGVGKFVERLESLNERFRQELKKFQVKETDFSRVQAAQDRGNLFIRRTVAVILGTYHQETEEAQAMRRTLTAPILEQCDRVRQLRKSRRNAADVDPETGEDVTAPEGTATA